MLPGRRAEQEGGAGRGRRAGVGVLGVGDWLWGGSGTQRAVVKKARKEAQRRMTDLPCA